MQTVDTHDTAPTFSSVIASLVPSYGEVQLLLTIAFHPDTCRIGETAVLCQQDAKRSVVIGRQHPEFTLGGAGPPSTLDEEHISRRAVMLTLRDEGVEVEKIDGASRCRLNSRELQGDPVKLTFDQLDAGVPLMLGHGVVLLLHRGSPHSPGQEMGNLGLVGCSAAMARVRQQVLEVASAEVDVLIRGETGTGKELVARAIHDATDSVRLVAVNMAAIPPGVAAAMLFGASKGAFTGADRASRGYFEQAERGTLFLDEVGDTPAEVQPQLLRVLQQREIQPVGGPPRPVNVRVVSATDANLDAEGCDFKAALRYRLGACEIELPALRCRKEDIAPLLLFFLEQQLSASGKSQLLPGANSSEVELALWAQLFHCFLGYRWPGNVRELENAARAVALASDDALVLPQRLHQLLTRREPEQVADEVQQTVAPLSSFDDQAFEAMLEQFDFEVAPAASALQVSRQSVYRRVRSTPGLRLAVDIPLQELEATMRNAGGDVRVAAKALRVSASGLRKRLGPTGTAK